MVGSRLNGLIAATYTPMHADGQLDLAVVGPMVEHLIRQGLGGIYVCGSTGEGMSLTTDERKSVAGAFVRAADGRLPVIIQVGHNSLDDARELARHAADVGADLISATCPSYYKVNDVETLTSVVKEIAAAAPETPFYYYHIPALTGSQIDIVEFLDRGRQEIPTLVGLKYTDTRLFEFQVCQALAESAIDVVWGCDEMLLGALATGANAAIGSTYNALAPINHRLIAAFRAGDLEGARAAQMESITFIRLLFRYPFHPAMKLVLGLFGVEAGGCRLPHRNLTRSEASSLTAALHSLPFFEELLAASRSLDSQEK